MFNLTYQEKSVILFLVSVAIIGIGTSHYLKKLPNPEASGSISQDNPSFKLKQIDLNEASIEELMTVPGIGSKLAQRIVEYRKIHGSYIFIEDIKKVRGIGQDRFKKIKEYFVIE